MAGLARRTPTTAPTDWGTDDLNRLLGRWFGEVPDGFGASYAAYPADIYEESDAIHVEAELPGFRKDEIDITVTEGVLRITAERGQRGEGEGDHLRERQWTRYDRAFSLPAPVDDSNAEAKYEEGVLYLTLPKHGAAKPRKIDVKG